MQLKGSDALTNQQPLLWQSQLPVSPAGGKEVVGEERLSLQSR